jgi:Superfamily I DNA and RNA helicases
MPNYSNRRYGSLEDRYINAKRALFDKYYSFLNDKQREAVYTVNGPLLILAGAGSGKTTVLVNRIGYIIKYGNAYFNEDVPDELTKETVTELESAAQNLTEKAELEATLASFAVNPCPPWAALAITFTNKAANEIKSRLIAQLGDETAASDIWAGTFHSICMRILRRYGDKVGYLPGFGICDADDAKKLVSACMKELNIDDKMIPVKSVITAISRAKDNLMKPDDYALEAGNDYKFKQIANIYYLYQKKLSESNLLDFDDIIMQTVLLLDSFDEVRDYYCNRFRYVCVDEYQDTNKAQLALTLLLSERRKNIMVVGDDDQSIYKFRGATIENILEFDGMFENTKVIKLEQNYRSTHNILEAANKVITNNSVRKGKYLWTAGERGNLIGVKMVENQNTEARYIINTIGDIVRGGEYRYKDVAILYRMNAQSRSIESAFSKSGIPYRILGGLRFFDRMEIRDIIAYLFVINNNRDAVHLRRIINQPKRGIGDMSLNTAEMMAVSENMTLFEMMKRSGEYVALSRISAKMTMFTSFIDTMTELAQKSSISELIDSIIEMSGYKQMVIDAGEDNEFRLENLKELVSVAVEYEQNAEEPTLDGFLEEISLVADVDKYDEKADAVVMMTVHSSKGLEFPVVFLPGMEEGIFPGSQSVNPEDIEEERRLAYVAITRAKRELYISHAKERMLYKDVSHFPISRFVGEIPAEFKDSDDNEQANSNKSIKRFVFDSENLDRNTYQQKKTADRGVKPDASPTARRNASKAAALQVAAKKIKTEEFAVGDGVFSPSFGKGQILSVRVMGTDTLYEVAFDDAGTKKLMATYARLTKAK